MCVCLCVCLYVYFLIVVPVKGDLSQASNKDYIHVGRLTNTLNYTDFNDCTFVICL